ncbi:SH3 domain-containing protein [Planctomicrobium piriforme]|uniref:SH3 domain-containing protein n=1 Tax=Planctomicrobium piriforme TaxID=1576369 RepID=A0A1I3D997_9PLAN|nr:SH3 domain-containing protein [Planctomicrobium piriforme]SFH83263.1 hypothetical protein SAMN05421753_103143 [Planctomicrobium piriforme]
MVRPFLRILLTILCAPSAALIVNAAEQQFPYQAVVVREQAEVRCGPGGNFYVTGMVKMNDQVVVHRHDHGGWYMIAPPSGSFSWIEASLVQQSGSNQGVVSVPPDSGKAGRAVVRIGSRLSDDHGYYGRELSHGDEVTILGEKVLSTARGPVKMLMIVPPSQEFRWVKGEALVPQNHQIQQQMAADPYQVPPQHRQRLAAEGKTPIAPLVVEDAPPKLIQKTQPQLAAEPVRVAQLDNGMAAPLLQAPPVSAPPSAPGNQDFIRLDEIDREYAEIVKKDPSEWKLAGIVQAYRDLMDRAPANVDILIRERLEVAVKRQEIAEHYQTFVKVSAETAQRDAQLLMQQADFQAPAEGPLLAPTPDETFVQGASMEQVKVEPQPTAPVELSPTPQAVTPRLNGAGILQKMQGPPGVPGYALTAPDGRMLAYVSSAQGIALEGWVGKPVGLIGQRSRDAALGSDHIRVQKVVPVQLSP